MNNFKQLISDFDNRLAYDVKVHGYITLFDYRDCENIIKLCEMNNVPTFIQKFTEYKSQHNNSGYSTYESTDILGNICYCIDYYKGNIFYKIYDYEVQLKQYKKNTRLYPIRKLKRYREKRVQKIRQETIISFFKLYKGAK